MTCVLGYVDEHGVGHIVADSAGTNIGQHWREDNVTKKIFKKGDMLIGYTSSFRMGQIIEHCFDLPERVEGLSDFEYLVKCFVPALREAFVNGKWMQDSERSGGTLIIVWNSNVYQVQDDFAVFCLPNKIIGCGSGYTTALTAFNALKEYGVVESRGVEECLKKSLEITSEYNITVSGRIDYLSNK